MKSFLSFLKATLIGGLFLIIPIFIVIFLVVKIIAIFREMVDPIADRINVSFFGFEMTSRIIAILFLLLICFLAGIYAKSKNATGLKDWVEDHILSNIPGYTLIKGITETAAGLESHNLKEVVLVNIEEVWQIGFLMERIDDDLNAVFIPGAPNPLAGDVVYVNWDRLQKLNIDELSVMKIYRKLGIDSKKILAGKVDKSIFDKKQ